MGTSKNGDFVMGASKNRRIEILSWGHQRIEELRFCHGAPKNRRIEILSWGHQRIVELRFSHGCIKE